MAGLASAAEPLELQVHSSETYFSPNGDGQDDVASMSYCLSRSANVDIWVADGSGDRVRSIESGVSHQGSCAGPLQHVEWDGKDDAGQMVPDGVYTAHLQGRAADAESGDVTVRLGIDTRVPGALTSPSPAATLSGTVEWAFTPTSDVDLDLVSVSCQGGGGAGASSDSPGPDGRFSGTLEVSGCTNGDNRLASTVSWTDPFGRSHSWSAPPVAVTVGNPPQLTIASGERYFSPNGDDQEDVASVTYCLSQPAEVDIWVADGSGTRVRTIESKVSHGTSCGPFGPLVVSWDGKDDAGQVVADGVYVVHLLARNAGGDSGGAAVRVGVETRSPGALTAPSAGAELSGPVDWAFTPTGGFSLDQVSVTCQGSGGYVTSDSPGPDGRFSGTLEVSDCSNGDNQLQSYVGWTDAFGQQHNWSAPAVTVTVGNAPQLTVQSPQRYFSPDGDDQEDTVNVSFCLSQTAAVDIWVADESGARVRTIEDGVAHHGSVGRCSTETVSWDGKDDAGRVVADGVYVVHLLARNAASDSGGAAVRLGVDTRTPGALTGPSPGAVVSGPVAWMFTPTGGFSLDRVSVTCQGSRSYVTSDSPGPDGRFSGTLEVSNCTNGDNQLQSVAVWTDPFGQQHNWSAPAVTVTVGNAPQLTVHSLERYFSPNGDDQEDTASVTFCLSQKAAVDIWVADGSGARVRTIEDGVAHDGSVGGCSTETVSWDGKDNDGRVVADGVYVVHLLARNAASDSGGATLRLGVDTRTPGALTTPAPGDTLAGLARFAFQPAGGFTPDQVGLSFDTGGGAAIHNPSPDGLWRTSMYTGSLRNGPAKLRTAVSYRDPFGASHTVNVAEVPVVIDDTALPLAVAADPSGGPAPLATRFRITTSDPQARRVHYTVNFGDGTAPAAGDIDAPYADAEVAHTYRDPGAYRAVVTVTNAAGSSSTKVVELSASGAGNTAPTATLELDATSGVAPLPVEVAIGGSDVDGDRLTYSLDFGDGSPPATGSLPHDQFTRSYDKAGTYLVRLAVSDGKLTAVKTATVVVGSAEPLAANAGDDQAAVVNDPVRFDGGGSRPPAGIESYRWDFGDGTTADGASVDHAYAAVGSYTATLTVAAGGRSETDTATITVGPKLPQDGLVVAARDEGGAPLADTQLLIVTGSGTRYSATTDAGGSGTLLGLADGTYTVYAWRQGYLPAKATATVDGGAGEATVTLKAGQVATASLTSTPLTLEQVTAAGIDPTDPDNQHVYEFKIHLSFEGNGSGTTEIRGFTASGGFPQPPSVPGTDVVWNGSGEASFTLPGPGGYQVSMSVSYVHDQPQLLWLIIPGKATWLKEFFSVQMMVTNLADPDFTLENGAATLTVPEGLTLAPTAAPQAPTATLEAIPGGQSRTATWVLRGDTEGRYDLAASYAGTLEPFGDTVTMQAATERQLHVWGGSALELVVDTDDAASEAYPYHVTVGLKNVADVPVYNPTIELLKEGKKNYIYQPREQLVVTAAELAPGEILQRDYILVPTISGTLNLDRSFVSKTAGDVELPARIISHPPVNHPATAPEIKAFSLRGKIGLQWEPVVGATSYQIYSTPDSETDFPADPVAEVDMLAPEDGMERAVVRGRTNGEMSWYAVSPVVDGRPLMSHPMVPVSARADAPSPAVSVKGNWPSHRNHICGSRSDDQIDVIFSDPFFQVTSYSISDGPSGSGSFGHSYPESERLEVPLGQKREITVKVANSDGDVEQRTETFDTLCERQSAVVLAAGLNSSLDAGGSTSPVLDCNDRPGGEQFNLTMATNACLSDDPQGVLSDHPQGNLVSYLMGKGYEPGERRDSPNRTLLEFSYNGATASCVGGDDPTFVPNAYTGGDTWRDIREELSLYRTSTASAYVDALEEYSSCWKERHGLELQFTVIGHSEGGYEALAIASEAASKGYEDLISNVVTVDGAIHPHVVLSRFDLVRCFTGVGQINLPDDVAAALRRRVELGAAAAEEALQAVVLFANENWTKARIDAVNKAGTKVVTITNYFDGCLHLNATLSNAAPQKILFVDHGTTGSDKHSAVLKAHDSDTIDPGFPLTSFLDTDPHCYIAPAGSVVFKVSPAAQATECPAVQAMASRAGQAVASPPARAMASPAAQAITRTAAAAPIGRLVGRVVDPATGAPVSTGGQVVVVGPAGSTYTNVGPDGSFAFDGLSVGDYRLFVNAFTGVARGAWVGGSTLQQATPYRVDGTTTEVGNVSGGTTKTLAVELVDGAGKPVPDGVAVLLDSEGRMAARSKADAAGRVELTAPPGHYTVGAASTATKAASIDVDLATTSDVRLQLGPAAVVTATVKDEKGVPLPSVAAALYLGEQVVAVGFTGVDGTYTFGGLDPGDYTVKLYEALDRFELPAVALPATAVVGDPAAGQVTYTEGQTLLSCTIVGTAGNDRLRGTPGDDVICGLEGNDVIDGRGGNDRLIGGDGADRLLGGAGNDTLLGEGSGDRLYGASGDDQLQGSAGPDRLVGGGGTDALDGGEGGDRLYGESGDDRLLGGAGPDRLVGGRGVDTLDGGGDDDRLYGSDGNDELAGGDGNDRLVGDGGNDRVIGGAGDDAIVGASGDDELAGEGGNDRLYGDAGNDRMAGGDGNDRLVGGRGNDRIDGGDGDDLLIGEAGDDELVGGPGNDRLDGGAGNDRLAGDAGSDRLVGSRGNDELSGGIDPDILLGGSDDDRLDGGEGSDTCHGNSGQNILTSCEP